ncbi:type III polyketide synthase [Ilyomonas limi]|uniref:Type III polyketide synthase n=1 Tax=Ilyomonas limi TaxID=2575867 RepID=A0A4U3L5C3_9BACT|nr:type III polyketide synthase [Ilyomonas limi]
MATTVPEYCHRQKDILQFMQQAYNLNATDRRKLAFMYHYSGIENRYSVLKDFSQPPQQWQFINIESNEYTPLDKRMELYKQHALPLSSKAAQRCLKNIKEAITITHLITVSCTGMSAPGLDLELVEALQLSPNVFRTSVNFMGCYAGVHALKLGKMICDTDAKAYVLIVATELCTLHFQQEYTPDNAASSLLFADGSAALLMSNDESIKPVATVTNFHSAIAFKGIKDMAWEISSKGFLMTLSGYVPQLIEEDITALVEEALQQSRLTKKDIAHWCIHPGGRKIIDTIQKQLGLNEANTQPAREVLRQYGNMSSATIFFVLDKICRQAKQQSGKSSHALGVAFGPGLTMETFTAVIA